MGNKIVVRSGDGTGAAFSYIPNGFGLSQLDRDGLAGNAALEAERVYHRRVLEGLAISDNCRECKTSIYGCVGRCMFHPTYDPYIFWGEEEQSR